jgi:CO/xanthine dehydrogenase Mo-binding subunit
VGQERIVGKPVLRKEGIGKVCGRAQYIDDLSLPRMLHGATVRSSIARGRILEIEFGEGIPWEEFAIVTATDIPGVNEVAMINHDWPCLAAGEVNHPEEPIVLLAHANRHLLPEAVAAVRVRYEESPASFSIEESERCNPVVWGEDNVFKSFLLEKGDVDSVWATADFVIAGEYRTGAQEHLYIENNGALATYSADEGLTVWGSLQCPFYVHKSLVKVTALPEEKVRVVQMETGGAFGGKEDYPSMIGAHAALLAMKSGRPVKMVYDRAEDMAATTKRHPSRVRHRTAVTRDGRLLGGEIEIALDGGAYSTLSPTVLSRATIHAGGPYYWPNIRVRSKAYATNCPPHGAFRGFGAPQSLFAVERHMDHIAEALGMPPEELRRRNFLKPGQTTTTGQEIREDINLDRLMERALDESDYVVKRALFSGENARESTRKRGIGLAALLHGSGFTGSGERTLNSLAAMDVTAAGKARVLVSSTEFGQGTNTILCQIAAETLSIDYDAVEMGPPDTSVVPNTGPTVASRTSMVVGKLVHSAALGLKQTLLASGLLGQEYTTEQFVQAARTYVAQHSGLRSECRYQAPPGVHWDDQTYRGEAYAAYAWAVYVAEVTVDLATYGVTLDDFVAVQEVGRVLNPVLARGQIEGGVAQGIGWALYENVVWIRGRMANNQMTNYIIPTSEDIPPIRVFFEELPFGHGAYGAKGIGELPMDGPAPAILNAVAQALGRQFDSVPLLPEDIFRQMAVREPAQEVVAL